MRGLLSVIAFSLLALSFTFVSNAGEKKGEPVKEGKKKDAKEGRKGTTIGVLVKKEKNTIEVLADGEEAPRKYVPPWKGGLPKDGGGPDKAILKLFEELKVGSRVEVEWMFEERLRALSVKVLEKPKEKK